MGFQVLVVVGGDVVVDGLQGSTDPGLFSFEHVEGHRVGVANPQQLEALSLQIAAFPSQLLKHLGLRSHESVELSVQHPGHVLAHLHGDLDSLVVVLDQMFHVLDEHVLPGAVGTARMPARAHEVRVDPALMVARVADGQPRTTLPAIHRALQIVVMELALVRRGHVRIKDGLDLIPDLARHERLMGAPVGHILVGDITLVTRVAQHPAQRGLTQRL